MYLSCQTLEFEFVLQNLVGWNHNSLLDAAMLGGGVEREMFGSWSQSHHEWINAFLREWSHSGRTGLAIMRAGSSKPAPYVSLFHTRPLALPISTMSGHSIHDHA